MIALTITTTQLNYGVTFTTYDKLTHFHQFFTMTTVILSFPSVQNNMGNAIYLTNKKGRSQDPIQYIRQ